MPTEAFSKELESAVDTFIKDKEEQHSAEEKNEVDDAEDTDVKSEDKQGSEEVLGEGEPEPESEDEEKLVPDSDTSEAPEKEVKKDKAKEPDLQVISDYALTKAVQAGLSVSEARTFSSDASLLTVVDTIERKSKDSKKEEVEEEEFEGVKIENRDDFEPDVLKLFDSMNDLLKKQNEKIKGLESKSADYGQQTSRVSQEVAEREITDWFDRKVAGLGKDYEDVLGKGGYNEIDKSSDQFKKRDEVASQVALLMAGYQASGREVPDRDKLFDQATKMVLSDEMQKVKEKKLANDLGKRSKQHLNRPGSKAGRGAVIKGTDYDPLMDVAQEINTKFFGK
jgi:hypothetical protein